jgi:hypothetical protein
MATLIDMSRSYHAAKSARTKRTKSKPERRQCPVFGGFQGVQTSIMEAHGEKAGLSWVLGIDDKVILSCSGTIGV